MYETFHFGLGLGLGIAGLMALAGHAVGYGKGKRLLARERRAASRTAWREGYLDGVNDERQSQETTGGMIQPNRNNPYEKDVK